MQCRFAAKTQIHDASRDAGHLSNDCRQWGVIYRKRLMPRSSHQRSTGRFRVPNLVFLFWPQFEGEVETMMIPQVLRVSRGLAAALLAAALCKFVLFDMVSQNTSSNASAFWPSCVFVAVHAMPLAVLAVIATEYLRLRHVAVHIAVGSVLALLTAHHSVRGESLVSTAFSGGALAGWSVVVAGVLSSLAYWAFAGRQAGWRGDAAERAATMVTEAFRTASANAQVEYCKECLAGWSALGVLLFMLFSWLLIGVSGLHDGLVTEAEMHGKTVLKTAGYTWAKFKVDGNRGVIAGLAPDEVQKRAAYDSVREALGSITGFPGILTRIENEAVARVPVTAVSEQLADAMRREEEAKLAIEQARKAADAARAAEKEAVRMAGEKVQAVEAETKRKLEEQALAAEAEVKRRLEEQARAVEETARQKAAAPAPEPVETSAVVLAAAEPGEQDVAMSDPKAGPQAGNDISSPALETGLAVGAGSCTSQDLAIVESSNILFDMQQFEVAANYNAELDRIAASAKVCAPRPILVSGLSGSNGDSLFNSALGLQRAEAVRERLIERGVPSTLVITRSTAPAFSFHNDTGQEARAEDRKAEFRFLEVSEISRDAKLNPEERATTCESDLAGIMERSTIYFATASARIGEESMGLIKELASAIVKCGSVIVTVEGHTDKTGDANYNQGLSETRASAVREALVVAGANPTRVATRGFAATRPQDPAATAAAFALNRRIEFKVSGKFTSTNAGGP